MGNCLRRESGMEWAGEDWGSLESKSHHSNSMHSTKDTYDNTEKLKLLGEIRSGSDIYSSSSSSSGGITGLENKEVKIKISKKELEQLVERFHGVQGLSIEQVLLSHLMNGGDYYHYHDHDLQRQWEHQRSWRPVLQSIPEVN